MRNKLYFKKGLLLSAVVLIVLMVQSFGQYVPPIGIPMPVFGLNEVAPDLPTDWNSDVEGFYYVQSGGSNSGNGYPANPTNKIPGSLPAGAVVVLAGEYTQLHDTRLMLNGTAESPIFIISSSTNQAILKKKFNVGGSYYIIDGINAEWDNSSGNGKMGINGSYCAIKNGNFRGDTNKGIGSVGISNGDNVLFYNNTVRIAGDWQTAEDQDTHAMSVGQNISYLWVLDSKFSRSSGDGIQINAGNTASQPNTHHIYIGRNEAFENKQNGFWTKQANDVIFSENIVHDHVPSGSSPGVGLGGQYGPERVWFIYNEIYNNYGGITLASRSDGIGEYAYFIGNEIYNNNLNPNFDASNSWSNAAITVTGAVYVAILNNVMVNNSGGIHSPVGNAEFLIYNNIIDNPSVSGANSVYIYESSTADISSIDNNIFNDVATIKWGTSAQNDLSGFKTAFDKCLSCQEINPQYVDAATANFALQSSSPAIDAGVANAVYNTFFSLYGIDIKVDANNTSRPQGSAWDIGAYEYVDGSNVQYNLSTSTVGNGAISTESGTYTENTIINLTAIPDDGWQFDGWSGDITGTTNPVNLTMDASKTVTATFSQVVLSVNDVVSAEQVLFNAHPNPFSLSTTISYSLPQSGRIKMEIYNLAGTKVADVFSGEQRAGEHTLVWSRTKQLPRGIYMLKIFGAGVNATTRVMIE